MASKSGRGFATTGRAGGGGSGKAGRSQGTGGRSQGTGGRLQSSMANSGTKGGRGVNRTAASQRAALNNTRVPGANVALGGSPRKGKLP